MTIYPIKFINNIVVILYKCHCNLKITVLKNSLETFLMQFKFKKTFYFKSLYIIWFKKFKNDWYLIRIYRKNLSVLEYIL